MYKNKQDLFSTGELAKLCNISRKTLLFYDKLGLIVPAFIDQENGYRYYARRQLTTLGLIITMRNINVPLGDIQNYLKHKSAENYEELLAKQDSLIEQSIYSLMQMRQELAYQIQAIKSIHKIVLNKFIINEDDEEYLFLSKSLPKKSSMKSRNKIYGLHFSELQNYMNFSNYMTGYVIDHSALAKSKEIYIKNFYHNLSHRLDTDKLFVKPKGTYLSFYSKGIFCTYGKEKLFLMQKYIEKNHLITEGDFFLTQIKNYWITDIAEEYITKLSIKLVTI